MARQAVGSTPATWARDAPSTRALGAGGRKKDKETGVRRPAPILGGVDANIDKEGHQRSLEDLAQAS